MTGDDWATQPAPGEENIPPLAEVKKWDPEVNGSGVIFGVNNYPSQRLVALAVVDMADQRGWDPQPGDPEILEKVRRNDLEDPTDQAIWSDIYEDVEDWLNIAVCPDGYMFGFSTGGNFMLLTDEAWCERAGFPCHDTDHKHPAPDGEWKDED